MNAADSFGPKTIVIYSVGLLGGSLSLALKASGYRGRIIGLSSPSAITAAKELGCIDEGYGYEDLSRVVAQADALFLCSPISVIRQCLEKLGTLSLPQGLLITDVGSTKKAICETAKESLPAHVHFLGGHPMAGSEKHGPSAADPYLFQNALYVLTPPQDQTPSARDQAVAAFLSSYLGCRHIFLDPGVHDAIAAAVSHVPHVLAVALVNLAKKTEERIPGTFQLAAGGFRDLTRIASSPYAMWHDIFATNTEAVDGLLAECMEILASMRVKLRENDLRGFFESAAAARRQIPSAGKGFITPLHEVLVVVKDSPGMIASIAGSLADKNVNIKDIEVLKVREGEGGTLRLAFESGETARAAIDILNRGGFSARERK